MVSEKSDPETALSAAIYAHVVATEILRKWLYFTKLLNYLKLNNDATTVFELMNWKSHIGQSYKITNR